MRVLVTGGAGFIGSHIVDRLLSEGNEVLVVDDMSAGKLENLDNRARLEKIDIGSDRLLKIMSDFRPSLVTHCAAQASVAVSMKDPAKDARTNILGGLNVLAGAASANVEQVVYINTGGALYGVPKYLPCDEEHPVRPISAYGLSKWTLEQYFMMLVPKDMKVKVLRLANVYGPRQNPEGEAGVVSIFAQRMLHDQPVTIFGDGEQTRDFVYVGDVADAHEKARKASGVFAVNIGSGDSLSVNQVFRILSEQTGYARKPLFGPERPGDVKHIVLKNRLAKEMIGWSPKTSFSRGIMETINWLKAQAS